MRRRQAYRVVPVYKGSYAETVSAAIFAFRSRSQPAIVQVNEIATATMMAAKGAIYPVYDLMRDEAEPFLPTAYLPAVTGYYTDLAGNMLSLPFNASTPILYYNKELFRKAGLDPEVAPKTWPEVGAAAQRLRVSGVAAGSPRTGRRGSMWRIFRRCTMCRSPPNPTASAGSTRR